MPIAASAIIKPIDELLLKARALISKSPHDDSSGLPDEQVTEMVTLLHTAIERASPAGTKYRENAQKIIDRHSVNHPHNLKPLYGILKAIREDFANGNLQSIQELIHGELFSDFLEMAAHLLDEGYKDPAAVLGGGVLEGHLRSLCNKNGVSTLKPDGKPKNSETLNTELAGAGFISKLDQKNVTAWLGLRNNAAHGDYAKYTSEQVALLLDSVRNFVTRNPA